MKHRVLSGGLRGDGAAVAIHDLLGDGQAQPRPAGAGGAGGVQTIKPLKNIGSSSFSGMPSPRLAMRMWTLPSSSEAVRRMVPPSWE